MAAIVSTACRLSFLCWLALCAAGMGAVPCFRPGNNEILSQSPAEDLACQISVVRASVGSSPSRPKAFARPGSSKSVSALRASARPRTDALASLRALEVRIQI